MRTNNHFRSGIEKEFERLREIYSKIDEAESNLLSMKNGDDALSLQQKIIQLKADAKNCEEVIAELKGRFQAKPAMSLPLTPFVGRKAPLPANRPSPNDVALPLNLKELNLVKKMAMVEKFNLMRAIVEIELLVGELEGCHENISKAKLQGRLDALKKGAEDNASAVELLSDRMQKGARALISSKQKRQRLEAKSIETLSHELALILEKPVTKENTEAAAAIKAELDAKKADLELIEDELFHLGGDLIVNDTSKSIELKMAAMQEFKSSFSGAKTLEEVEHSFSKTDEGDITKDGSVKNPSSTPIKEPKGPSKQDKNKDILELDSDDNVNEVFNRNEPGSSNRGILSSNVVESSDEIKIEKTFESASVDNKALEAGLNKKSQLQELSRHEKGGALNQPQALKQEPLVEVVYPKELAGESLNAFVQPVEAKNDPHHIEIPAVNEGEKVSDSAFSEEAPELPNGLKGKSKVKRSLKRFVMAAQKGVKGQNNDEVIAKGERESVNPKPKNLQSSKQVDKNEQNHTYLAENEAKVELATPYPPSLYCKSNCLKFIAVLEEGAIVVEEENLLLDGISDEVEVAVSTFRELYSGATEAVVSPLLVDEFSPPDLGEALAHLDSNKSVSVETLKQVSELAILWNTICGYLAAYSDLESVVDDKIGKLVEARDWLKAHLTQIENEFPDLLMKVTAELEQVDFLLANGAKVLKEKMLQKAGEATLFLAGIFNTKDVPLQSLGAVPLHGEGSAPEATAVFAGNSTSLDDGEGHEKDDDAREEDEEEDSQK